MLRCRRIWCGGRSPISTPTWRGCRGGSSRTAWANDPSRGGMCSSRGRRRATFAAIPALLPGQAGQDQAGRDAVLRVWDAARAVPGYDGPPVWLHGDLHPANILVNDGQVSGVIDFGDITAGDPANDLSVAWMLLPLGCHARFWSAYHAAGGRPGDALRTRASGWALNLGVAPQAPSEDQPRLLAGRHR